MKKSVFLWKISFFLLAICSFSFLMGSSAMANSPQDLNENSISQAYQLLPDSNFGQGCVGPCDCPIRISGQVIGTFELVPLTPTPIFTRFAITDINWAASNPSGSERHTVTGNGFYQFGGEIALTQQMVLQLSIDGKKPVVFDSGLVPIETAFPDISISVYRGNTCFKTWISLDAVPK